MTAVLLLLALVAAIRWVLRTSAGARLTRFLPEPFWMYMVPIALATAGLLPAGPAAYRTAETFALPAALALLLAGVPVSAVARLGPAAGKALALGFSSMMVAVLSMFVLFWRWLPDEGWRAAGSLLATWTGGSANMLAVKEVVALPDASLAPLVLVDAFLSYGWLALLLAATGAQRFFPSNADLDRAADGRGDASHRGDEQIGMHVLGARRIAGAALFGAVAAALAVGAGRALFVVWSAVSPAGWTVLVATTGTLAVSSFSGLRGRFPRAGSSVGTFLLYVVIATIGARTPLTAVSGASVFLGFGAAVLCVHGALLFGIGRMLGLPLFLLATASQAGVGGPVSAPIVAAAYRPGFAHVGALMAVVGAIFGTYIGVFGGWVCRLIAGAG